MTKTLLVAAALVLGTGSAFAMSAPSSAGHHMMMKKRHRVTASGRCNGVSYGTGQRSCGTATGGTPGGNPSRN